MPIESRTIKSRNLPPPPPRATDARRRPSLTAFLYQNPDETRFGLCVGLLSPVRQEQSGRRFSAVVVPAARQHMRRRDSEKRGAHDERGENEVRGKGGEETKIETRGDRHNSCCTIHKVMWRVWKRFVRRVAEDNCT